MEHQEVNVGATLYLLPEEGNFISIYLALAKVEDYPHQAYLVILMFSIRERE